MSQRFASCTCGRLQLGCQGEPVWTENKHAWLCLPEVPRDNQGETAASIRMRMRRGWTDGARA